MLEAKRIKDSRYKKHVRLIFLSVSVLLVLSCGGETDGGGGKGASSSSSSSTSSGINKPSSSSSSSSSSGVGPIAGSDCSEVVEEGKILYEGEVRCSQCHGLDGSSMAFKQIDLTAELYRHSTMAVNDPSLTLPDYIAAYMPPGAGSCKGDCAKKVSAYVRFLGGQNWCPSDVGATEKTVPMQAAHRLNNGNYEKTIYALTGVTFDASKVFPIDAAVGGFDNAAEGLSMTTNLVSLYFAATEEILASAFARYPDLSSQMNPEGCNVSQNNCALQIIHRLAERAYRRKQSNADKDQLTALFDELMAHGDRKKALEHSVKTILLSPRFLFRSMTIGDIENPALDPMLLAHRLSYFLWSTIPDENLLNSAKSGVLTTPAELTKQVKRMIDDSKAQGFLDDFVGQWLLLRSMNSITPSTQAFPQFNKGLKTALIKETEMFIKEFMTTGIPVRRMVDPDFGFMNDALASHYRLPAPNSDEMIKVPLGAGDRRGIFALGGWLAALSDGDHTNPIRRGSYILERLTCTPTGSPPPDAPTDLPNNEAGTLTMRERLAQHRIDPSCASCHDFIDPAGLGFELFDALGAPRQTAVDSRGALPGGFAFDSPMEIPDLMTGSRVVTDCMTRNLYSYAHGRQLTDSDELFISDLLMGFDGSESFTDVLVSIVTSPSFVTSPTLATLHKGPVTKAQTDPSDPDPVDPKPVDPMQGMKTWQFCANEGSSCSFDGTKVVRFGKDGTWAESEETGSVECTRFVFGDPLPDVRKVCEILEVAK